MNCAEFEARLVELLGDDVDPQARARGMAELRRHATGCGDGAGSAELLEQIALAASNGDGDTDPGAGYWSDFNRRVWERLEAERADEQRRRRGWAAVAVVLLAALVGVAGLKRLGDGSDGSAAWSAFVAEPDPLWEPLDFPDELESWLERPPADPETRATLTALAGITVDPTAATDAPAGYERWLAGVDSEPAVVELEAMAAPELPWRGGFVVDPMDGSTSGGWLFPDPLQLSDAERRSLLEWLQVQLRPEKGVSS